MKQMYEVVFHSGDEPLFPAYYRIGEFECANIRDELKNNLKRSMQRVRKMFVIGDDVPDWKIYEALYILKEDGLISAKSIA